MDPGLKKEGSKCDHEVGTPDSPSARSLQGASDRCSTASTRRHTSTLEESSTSQSQIYGARKEAAVCQTPPPPSSEETLMPDKPPPQKDSKEGVKDSAEDAPRLDPREPLPRRASLDQHVSKGDVVRTETPVRSLYDVAADDAASVENALSAKKDSSRATELIAEHPQVDPRVPLSKHASIDESVSLGLVICTKHPPRPPTKATAEAVVANKDILGAIEATLQGIEDIAEMPYVDPREPLSQRASIDSRISLGMVVPTKPASHSPLKAIPTDHATVVGRRRVCRRAPLGRRPLRPRCGVGRHGAQLGGEPEQATPAAQVARVPHGLADFLRQLLQPLLRTARRPTAVQPGHERLPVRHIVRLSP